MTQCKNILILIKILNVFPRSNFEREKREKTPLNYDEIYLGTLMLNNVTMIIISSFLS